MKTDLSGKSIVVTGGSRGIGFTIAEACVNAGARVLITSRNAEELNKAKFELQKSSGKERVFTLVCDASAAEDSRKMADWCAQNFGSVFGLVTAAGIYGPIGPFSETNFDEWEKTISINLVGSARSLHSLLPLLRKGGEGRVVFFSGGGQGAMPNFSPYVTSKGGIWRLTETLGHELAPSQIFVNALAPGAVNTKLLDELLKAGPEKVGKTFFEKSIQQKENGGESPEKAARLVLYLMSERSRGLYGKTLSAVWDDYEQFKDLARLSQSEMYCVRRVSETP